MATTGRPSGRPPKPTEVKRALGNPGKRPLPQAPKAGEGLPASNGIPKAPRELGKKGKELWNKVWAAGEISNHLSPLMDTTLILMLCQAYDQVEWYESKLEPRGDTERVYLMSNGAYSPHPYVKEIHTLTAKITAWLSMLGFSPTDRTRLGIGEVKASDPLDELNKRRKAREAIQEN
jgi:P27 family predicted phage terminase small subunit